MEKPVAPFDQKSSIVQVADGSTCILTNTIDLFSLSVDFGEKSIDHFIPVEDLIVQFVEYLTREIWIGAQIVDLQESIFVFSSVHHEISGKS